MKGEIRMNVHELRILSEYFNSVVDGIKTFEIRKDDRGYKVGDLLFLKEWDENGIYTGRSIIKEVVYLTNDAQKPSYVVLAIKEPSFDVLNRVYGYNKAVNLTIGCEPIWVLEQATDEDLEASISVVDATDVI